MKGPNYSIMDRQGGSEMRLFLDGIQMICSLFLLRLPQCPTSYLAEGRHHGFHIVHLDFCTPIPKSLSLHFIQLQPKFPVIFMDCLWLAEGGEGEEDAPHAFRPLAAPARMLSGILALSYATFTTWIIWMPATRPGLSSIWPSTC